MGLRAGLGAEGNIGMGLYCIPPQLLSSVAWQPADGPSGRGVVEG